MTSKASKLTLALIVAGAGFVVELMRRVVRNDEEPLASTATASTPSAHPPEPSPLDLSGASRQELYEEAQRLGIKGRSKMSKAQLNAALVKGAKQ